MCYCNQVIEHVDINQHELLLCIALMFQETYIVVAYLLKAHVCDVTNDAH